MYTNDTLGGLLNATFGNATEVIVASFAIKQRFDAPPTRLPLPVSCAVRSQAAVGRGVSGSALARGLSSMGPWGGGAVGGEGPSCSPPSVPLARRQGHAPWSATCWGWQGRSSRRCLHACPQAHA